ncbi:hypothetical protein [Aquimarina sp. 2201CG14-23]|uniref:hypothetical protein n=1 Tax=Aquimarina mycalae TaxID=3040073 RepID=UPI002477CC75|nr:hypothetical protein [Aquimarina sp. 2201CG14-23]MDH7444843.1 hypothetical protein [Aquimarina sp. 2201CG14-23]
MSTEFSMMVKQFVADGSIDAIPNPSRSGYLCRPQEFLSELIRFVSMMQVMKVGIGSEIATIKNDLEVANQSPIIKKSDDRLYNIMIRAIRRIENICTAEGERAQIAEEIELAETYAWSIVGCQLFLKYTESIER